MDERRFIGFRVTAGEPKYGTADMLTPIYSVIKVIDERVVEVLEYGRPIFPDTIYRSTIFRVLHEAHKDFERVLTGRGDL